MLHLMLSPLKKKLLLFFTCRCGPDEDLCLAEVRTVKYPLQTQKSNFSHAHVQLAAFNWHIDNKDTYFTAKHGQDSQP